MSGLRNEQGINSEVRSKVQEHGVLVYFVDDKDNVEDIRGFTG